jgi:hypothetical protein
MECCSYCGKTEGEVRKLIAGPDVHICDECVELCNDVLREELDGWDYGIPPTAPWAWMRFWDAAAQAALLGILYDVFAAGEGRPAIQRFEDARRQLRRALPLPSS